MFQNLPIRMWQEDDRPREKFRLKGKSSLSDAELVGVLIGHGTQRYSAVDLGKIILQHFSGDLNRLARASVADLCKIPGIGEAKAVSILAALELGARKRENPTEMNSITSSKHAYDLLRGKMENLPNEVFYLVMLNHNNKVMATEKISEGGINATVVDVRIILRKAIECSASAILVAHNHPSGSLKPSEQDVRITKQIKQAANLMEIALVDHIIVSGSGYYSFMDEGVL